MTDSPLQSYSYNISILACKVTGSGGYKAWITTLENFKGWSRSGLHYFISPFTGQIPMKNPNPNITTAKFHSSHTLVSNAQNSPSQASAIREP